jgi:flavodoxin
MKKIFGIIFAILLALPLSSNAQTKKVLVAYFSRTGENYAVGTISKGNTCIIAEMIAKETNGTLFEIKPVKAYPTAYQACTEQAKTERDNKARPAIKNDIKVENYDVIYIGYPNWWGDMPMPVYTFLEKHSWNGKTVIPFCTHEGSGLGSTPTYLKNACKGATIGKGLAIKGTTAQNQQETARASVKKWLKE